MAGVADWWRKDWSRKYGRTSEHPVFIQAAGAALAGLVGAKKIDEYLVEAERRRGSRVNRFAVAVALANACCKSAQLSFGGGAIDSRRAGLEARKKANPQAQELAQLLAALVVLHEEKRSLRGLRSEWRLKPGSARAAFGLVRALLTDYPELMLNMPRRLGLPHPPLLNRGRRGNPLDAVRSACSKSLALAGVPPQLRATLTSAVVVTTRTARAFPEGVGKARRRGR